MSDPNKILELLQRPFPKIEQRPDGSYVLLREDKEPMELPDINDPTVIQAYSDNIDGLAYFEILTALLKLRLPDVLPEEIRDLEIVYSKLTSRQ